MKQLSLLALLVLLQAPATISQAEETVSFAAAFPHSVPLLPTSSGSYTVTGQLGGASAEFLLDTGASMVTVSRELFTEVEGSDGVVAAGKVAARTASGKLELMDVYEVQSFKLGDDCELGPLKVAVIKRGGRNLLGMSALQQTAPFAVYTSPPALGLSQCGQPPNLAAR